MIKRIKLIGKGGQGIKLLGHVLGNILTELDYFVSLNFAFDTAVRGGKISADMVYSDKEIENPIIDEADILLFLGGTKEEAQKIKTKSRIVEKNICNEECTKCDLRCKGKQIPFYEIASQKFGSPIYMNMVALGIILKDLGIDTEKVNLKNGLPKEYIEKNLEAIKYGYTYRS